MGLYNTKCNHVAALAGVSQSAYPCMDGMKGKMPVWIPPELVTMDVNEGCPAGSA